MNIQHTHGYAIGSCWGGGRNFEGSKLYGENIQIWQKGGKVRTGAKFFKGRMYKEMREGGKNCDEADGERAEALKKEV